MSYQTARPLADFSGGTPKRSRCSRRHRPAPPPKRPLPRASTREEALPPKPAPPAELVPAPQWSWGMEDGWGPLVPMSENVRVQAAVGYRAAVIPLREGLCLVAELPDAVTRSEFGFAPLLAPLMVRAATRAMSNGDPAQPGLFQRIVDLRQQRLEDGSALVRQLRPERPPAPPPQPSVGWADPRDLNDVIGCGCRGGRR
ncbi:MAG: hypothetical protein H6739_34660 [Alphaproteobacteria bacterium]|nr:hypothetical protein [Alphaproteobacteria bacterium]